MLVGRQRAEDLVESLEGLLEAAGRGKCHGGGNEGSQPRVHVVGWNKSQGGREPMGGCRRGTGGGVVPGLRQNRNRAGIGGWSPALDVAGGRRGGSGARVRGAGRGRLRPP